MFQHTFPDGTLFILGCRFLRAEWLSQKMCVRLKVIAGLSPTIQITSQTVVSEVVHYVYSWHSRLSFLTFFLILFKKSVSERFIYCLNLKLSLYTISIEHAFMLSLTLLDFHIWFSCSYVFICNFLINYRYS